MVRSKLSRIRLLNALAVVGSLAASLYVWRAGLIRFGRRREHAVACRGALRQFLLQPLGLFFHSHPAQFADEFDQLV